MWRNVGCGVMLVLKLCGGLWSIVVYEDDFLECEWYLCGVEKGFF